MPYSISNIVVSSNGDKVVAIDWTYTNAKGQRDNRWPLDRPYGNTPLRDCTTEVLIGWLEEQFPEGTTAGLDRLIDEDIAREAEKASESSYMPHPDGPPTPVTQEIDVPDLPVNADVAPTSKSKKNR